MKQENYIELNIMHDEMIIQGYSKKTIDVYIYHNRSFLKFINKSPRVVTNNDIKSYVRHLTDKKYERNSINLIINSLMFYYKYILKRRFVIKRQRVQKKFYDVLSKEDISILFDSVKNNKHNLILMFLYYSGVRVSELINLKIKDIDINRMQIHVRNGKGRKDRFVPLNNSLLDGLKKYLNVFKKLSDDFLFNTKNDKKYTIRSIQMICKNSLKKAGIEKNITPHGFRRTYATHAIENETNIFHLQNSMGHSRSETTYGYYNYSNISKIHL